MYFANRNGVLEYDGVSWRLIKMPNLSVVRSLDADQNGRIYVGAQNEFGYLAPDSIGQMRYVSLINFVPEKNRQFLDVWLTFSTTNNVFFLTDYSLFRWTPQNLSEHSEIHYTDSKQVEGKLHFWRRYPRITDIYKVWNRIYAIQKDLGLFVVNEDSLQPVLTRGQINPHEIYAMLPYTAPSIKGSSRQILVGSRTEGLMLYDGHSFRPFNTDPAVANFLTQYHLFWGVALNDNKFALGTEIGGLVIIDNRGGLLTIIDKNSGLRDSGVNYLYPDRTGGLWVAMTDGLARVEYNAPFSTYQEASGLSTTTFDIIRHNEKLYVTNFSDIHVLSRSDRQGSSPIFKPLGISDRCYSLVTVNNELLAATRNGTYLINDDQATLIDSINTYVLYPSEHYPGQVYAGLLENGLAILRQDRDQWRLSGRVPGIKGEVDFIAEEKSGALWLSMTQKGVLRVDLSGMSLPMNLEQPGIKIEHYAKSSGLPDGSVEIYPLSTHIIFSTRQGLRRFDSRTHKFFPDSTLGTEFANMTNDYLLLREDRLGNIWMAIDSGGQHRIGKAVLRENGDYIWNFTDFNRMANSAKIKVVYPDEKNVVWFGNTNGLIRYKPSMTLSNKNSFSLLIRRVTIAEDSIIYGGTSIGKDERSIAVASAKKPVLDYNINALRLEYAATSYDDPAQNRYQTFLEGFDKDWAGWTTESQKDYTNLPEGSYRFRVRAKNVYDHHSQEAMYAFSVLPPWYRTWWAYLCYATAILGSFYGIRRYELNRQRLKHDLKLKQLQAAEERREAERFGELDQLKSHFFANISHELRTPLTLVLGQIENIRRNLTDTRNAERLIMARRNGQRLLILINQLLDVNKLEAGKMRLQARPDDLPLLFRRVVHNFESAATHKGVSLSFVEEKPVAAGNDANGAHLRPLYFDPEMMNKVMYNLVSNALKFTPAGGAVEVRVDRGAWIVERDTKGEGPFDKLRIDSGEKGEKQAANSGKFVRIRIKDTGEGIPAEKLPHIFDRFYQADGSQTRAHEGSGIGLALVHELVKLHHGDIRVNSEMGKGTVFTIRLPLGMAHLKPEQIAASGAVKEKKDVEQGTRYIGREVKRGTRDALEHQNTQTLKQQILIVEDNADLRDYMRDVLNDNHEILEAANGGDGLVIAREMMPDLIISDVMMPVMDGFAFSKQIREDQRTSHIPIIMVTARAADADKLAGLEMGVDAYLVKPFNPDELRLRVRKLIEIRQQLRERFSAETIIKPADVSVESQDQSFLKTVVETVDTGMEAEGFGVETLCRAVGMSKRQLQRKLKALINQTPVQLIRSLRLQRAKQLLEQNAGTVSEIAFRVGFNNLSYFTKMFRGQFGVAPSAVNTAKKGYDGDGDKQG